MKILGHYIKEITEMQLQLRQQVIDALNQQYKTRLFTCKMTARQMFKTTVLALQSGIDIIDFQLNGDMIDRYGIKIKICDVDPFEICVYQSVEREVQLVQLLNHSGKQTSSVVNNILQQIKDYVVQDGLGMSVTQKYHKYLLHFKKINVKQAILFQSLSKCQIFYTIMRERKKSGKQFYMDPLIISFQSIRQKLQIINNPFHESVLPKKALRVVQKKNTDKKMKNTLFDAVSNKRYKEARELIVKGASIEEPGINERTKRQMNCAHRACQLGDLQMCKILHSFNVNWQARQKQGMTPFHFAVQSGSLQLVKFLLEQAKVQLQSKDIQDRTCFYFACTEGDLPIIRYLYEKGVNINNKSKLGRSALSKACYLGLIDVVTYLLNLPGIVFTSQDTKGRTALHNSVFGPRGGREGHKFGTNQKDSPQCTQLLLERGFNVDYPDIEQNTPLHVSMSSDGIDSIRVLLSFGGSLKKLNCYQETPLMTGAKFGHLESVKILKQQYGSSLTTKDIFGKNLILLCAKFRQDDGKSINRVFYYGCDELLKMASQYEKLQDQGKNFIQNWFEQIDLTFGELLKEIGRVSEEFKYFCKKCRQFKLNVTNLTLQQIKLLLDWIKNSEDQQNFDLVQYLITVRPNKQKLFLKRQQFQDFAKWIIAQNSTKLLDFFAKIQSDLSVYLTVQGQTKLSLFEFLSEIVFQMMGIMKQKVLTYCLLKLNINWLDFIDSQHYYNILHLLVRHKKVGTLIQILKVLSGVKMDFITNCHILALIEDEYAFRKEEKEGESPQQLILKNMLVHKDRDGFDPYHLALLIKDASATKLLQQKTNKQCLMNKSQFQVKQYCIVIQSNPQQLQTFNKGYEIQTEFDEFIAELQSCSTRQQLSNYFRVLTPSSQLAPADISAFDHIWKNVHNRKLHHLSQVSQLYILKQLMEAKVIGIDIQYFYCEGVTLMSIMQISSIQNDYIIDFLTSAKNHQLYFEFTETVRKYLTPVAYNSKIMKVMHGSDNDLCVIKSVLKFSFLNFIDTARIDVQLRKEQNIRGLATLVQDYLKQHMSKDYQVSEWRIRPIPVSMLDYARRDSLVLPFLVHQMLSQLDSHRLKEILMNGVKQAKRNRKSSQPLISSIQAL